MAIYVSSGYVYSGHNISAYDPLEVLPGGTAEVITLLSGGSATLSSGSYASAFTVQSGGYEDIETGAAEFDSVVSAGGREDDNGGGDEGKFGTPEYFGASDDTVLSGGLLVVRAIAFDETVLSGGVAVIEYDSLYSYAAGDNVTGLLLSGGKADIQSGGVVSGATVVSGAVVNCSDGSIDNSVVSSGGKVNVRAFGGIGVTTVSDGGAVYVSSEGYAASDTLLAGGKMDVYSGGIMDTTTISTGGVAYVFGKTYATTVSAGGQEIVEAAGVGGAVSGETLASGGTEKIEAGGRASGTVVDGGVEYVLSGGVVVGAVVSARDLVVSSGGVVSGLSVLSGGQLTDEGTVSLSGGGALGGVLIGSGAIAQSGGGELVLGDDGIKFTGQAVIDGGTIELATHDALGGGSVSFVAPSTGSAVLQIDAADMPAAGATFANVISDFSGSGEDIDLTGLAYVSGATATLSGSTLVLHDGGKTYAFKLAGSTAAAYPVLSDGHGGTLIDPIPLTQAMAAFTPGSASTVAPVASSPHEPENQLLQATTLLLKTRS